MPKKVYRISLSDAEDAAVESLGKKYGKDNVQDILRYMISKEFEDYTSSVGGTRVMAPSRAAKRARDDKFEELKNMKNDEELTAALNDLGYFQDGAPETLESCWIGRNRLDDRVIFYKWKGTNGTTTDLLESIWGAVEKFLIKKYRV